VNNAQNVDLSPLDVVEHFKSLGYRVSVNDWGSIKRNQVDATTSCDGGRGYVLKSTGAGMVSYPKFQTEYGTCVSLEHGVWNNGGFDRSRLKFINLPVLKPHGAVYGVTACVKNFMGVVTNTLTPAHDGVAGGLMGSVMAEIGMPDLHILDCIWVAGYPGSGPNIGSMGTRKDQLVASTDPVAVDIWAATNILIPTFYENGFSPPWPGPDPEPSNPDSEFRGYLDRSMEWILDAGIPVTNDLDQIDVHAKSAAQQRTGPRRPGDRIENNRGDVADLLRRRP
jgi:hypothetical protein